MGVSLKDNSQIRLRCCCNYRKGIKTPFQSVRLMQMLRIAHDPKLQVVETTHFVALMLTGQVKNRTYQDHA